MTDLEKVNTELKCTHDVNLNVGNMCYNQIIRAFAKDSSDTKERIVFFFFKDNEFVFAYDGPITLKKEDLDKAIAICNEGL